MINVNKILKIMLVLLVVILMLSTSIYAEDLTSGMEPTGWELAQNRTSVIGKVLGMVLGVLQVIGVVVTVISIVIAGIKYMLSSTNDKATIKQQAVPLVIGGIIVFGASTLLKWISTFTTQALK